MGHSVKHIERSHSPKAKVFYEPDHQVLVVENGESSEVGEEMARGIHIMYNKDVDNAPPSAVTILIDGTESVLKPFVDAILYKYDISHDPELPYRPKKGYRETAISQVSGEEWVSAPHSEASYDASSQTLLIDNGEACEVSKEMARDVHVLFGKDYGGGARLASVAIRIDRAETVLKPFVDAILAKHGIKKNMT